MYQGHDLGSQGTTDVSILTYQATTIVFGSQESSDEHECFKGSLFYKHGDRYGAIDFLEIYDVTQNLTSEYWVGAVGQVDFRNADED